MAKRENRIIYGRAALAEIGADGHVKRFFDKDKREWVDYEYEKGKEYITSKIVPESEQEKFFKAEQKKLIRDIGLGIVPESKLAESYKLREGELRIVPASEIETSRNQYIENHIEKKEECPICKGTGPLLDVMTSPGVINPGKMCSICKGRYETRDKEVTAKIPKIIVTTNMSTPGSSGTGTISEGTNIDLVPKAEVVEEKKVEETIETKKEIEGRVRSGLVKHVDGKVVKYYDPAKKRWVDTEEMKKKESDKVTKESDKVTKESEKAKDSGKDSENVEKKVENEKDSDPYDWYINKILKGDK